jgi:rhamnulokinase
VFVGKDGALLRNPMAYRDPHTFGVMEKYFEEAVSKEEVYDTTGIQFMNFNSLFQLYAMHKAGNSAMENADKVLFVPDALSYMLTSRAICEYTVASTSQILDPNTRELSNKLIESTGLTRDQFGEMTEPATVIGTLTEEIQKITGLGAVPVIAVAGHDTASAVAAVPAKDEKFAYLSSGTWSLMGIETKDAIINEKSFELNFTNEGGIEGTTRFLKNICGMWLYESCRREWPEDADKSHLQMQQDAMQVEAFRSLINPDDKMFANPESMTAAIVQYCKNTNQPVPQTHAEFCRCIFDSLALRYRQVFSYLKDMASFPLDVLHIIGGGSKNYFLDQFTANSCGVKVVAGPQEGTAIGNIMLQAKASGDVNDIWEMRKIIADSIEIKVFEPQNTEAWDAAYEKYLKLCK